MPSTSSIRPAVFYILLALSREDLHGLGIVKAVDEATVGAVRLGPGTLYRSLKEMAASGLIEEVGAPVGSEDPRRRFYRITPVVSAHGPGEGLFRALVRLYPAAFRERYGDELLELFRHRREEWRSRGRRLFPAFWSYVLRDWAATWWAEWRRPMPDATGAGTPTGGDGMRGWLDDLTYAVRRLVRAPGFALTALVILVLGIGVNTTAFGMISALLFQEPPFDEPERGG